ncbi:MFS transporter [Janthinobacterium sp.]|uniref:MFS transporter n=1 Tax=Janthinobacterium sp. TaxID=1871054 RepID=UPI00293D7277|nr:MFS transporter [Janthinobacterium sp.]
MTTQNSSWGDLFSGKNAARSLALSGGVALHAINIYIATTILPTVVKEIGGLDLYAWNTTLFVVASILGSALTARLLQGAGPRAAYAVAGALFLAGSLICALAPAMPVLLLGRAVQGLGGGLLFALCYAMIQLLFEERLWPRAMALVSGMWGVATLVGPAIGGVFAEMGVWRAAFASLLPVTLAYLALTTAVLPRRDASQPAAGKLPLRQLLLLAGAVLAVGAGSASALPLWNVAGVAAALLLVCLLLRHEARAPTRLLPRNALDPGAPLWALYATMGLLVVGMTSEIFVPYFLQTLHGQSPLVSGYLAALMAAGWTLSEVISSAWKDAAARRAIVAGPLCVLAGLILLAVFAPRQGGGDQVLLALICVALTLVGFGIGLGWPHLLTRVLQGAAAQDQNAAAASLTTVQLFATALGAALAGMIANLAGLNDPGGAEGAVRAARWMFALFSVAPALALLTALRATAARRAGGLADGVAGGLAGGVAGALTSGARRKSS